ncbi:MAG: Crp/Fnr family transcriptional regulator [Prevotella sp.]|jgi:CRP-like cAMP-binding protein
MDYQTIVKNFLNVATLTRVLKRGEMLSDISDIGTSIYYVKSGAIKICYESEGKEHILEFGLEGRFVTNLLSFLTGKRTRIYLQAIKKTELVGVPRPYFTQLVKGHEELLLGYLQILETVLADRLEKEMILNLSSPSERIKALGELYPNIFQLVPQKYIAAYLNIAPETFSRQLNS